jgi:hypothetical protein
MSELTHVPHVRVNHILKKAKLDFKTQVKYWQDHIIKNDDRSKVWRNSKCCNPREFSFKRNAMSLLFFNYCTVMINNGAYKNKFWGCSEGHRIGWGTYEFRMPSRLPNPESETFFSIGPKYSNVAYKAELSSRAMTDKMAAVVSFCEVMDHRHHPLWVPKEKIPGNFCFHFSTST